MSNSSNDVKQKPVFSYARAAQGSSATTPTAVSPQQNGKTAPVANESNVGTANPNGEAPTGEKTGEKANENVNVTQASAPSHSSRSSISSAAGVQPAWANKGTGVHMPPRATPTPATTTTATASQIQFGNFSNQPNSPLPVVKKSPAMAKVTPAASGGIAPPPALQGKDAPQFGSIPSGNNALADARLPSHSRTNSNASDFRPSTMSPNPQHFPVGYPMGGQQQQYGYPQGQISPAMPNFRGGRGGSGQFQNRGGNRNVQGSRSNASTPMHNSQQHNPAPMGSPAIYQNYPVHQPMYQGYGGYQPQFGGYQNYQQQQHMPQNYVNMQANRPQGSYDQALQYQNPNLQNSSATTMSRSGSTISERPSSSMPSGPAGPGTPVPSAAPPSFQTPRKKGSSAIKIVNPNSKEEVVPPKTPALSEVKKERVASPSPKIERPMSSGPPRSSNSTPLVNVETPEQKKAKQDAARQAILDKIAAAKAAEQSEIDRKAEAEKVAKEEAAAAEAAAKEQEAKDKAAKEAERAETEAKLAREAAEAEAEKARVAKEVEEKQAAQKLAQEKEQAAKAEAEEKARRDAEEAAAEKGRREEAAQKEADAQAATEAATQKAAKEKADELAAEPEAQSKDASSTEDTAALDTIVESASIGQKPDVIETKPFDAESKETANEEASIDTTESDSPDSEQKKSVPEAPATTKKSPSAMITALRSSKRIRDISTIKYPSGISAPDAAINKNPQDGKIKYDKVFLLQFQTVYTDKPSFEWDDRIKSTMGDSDGKSGKGMGGRTSSNRGTASPFGGLNAPAYNAKPLKSSEDRFRQAEKMRAAGIDPAAALGGGSGPSFERGSNFKPATMSRKDSMNLISPRTESKRGGKGGRAPSNRPEKAQVGAATIAPEDVKPLANSGNRWTPKRAADVEPLPGAAESTAMAPEMVQRKVKGLLNKLTLDNFDRITDQILEIASQSKEEKDGRTLRQVIALTFEKATDESHFSNMYARFCRKMMECTSDEVKDEGITDKHGNQVIGGALFRKYLLSRCQEDFERGWKTDLPPKPDGEPQNEEAAMLSDEYYIAAAAKRRGLGLVRFVGELFLLQMLNEKIMQECVRKLLSNVNDPEEEEIESLSKLVETVGSALDSTPRGYATMDAYIGRMQLLTKCSSLSSRIKFMVMDVIDLRRDGWVGSKTDKGPKTIQQIHDEAAKAAALKEAQRGSSHRGGSMGGGGGRMDFGRGDVRNTGSRRQDSHGPTFTTGADGWSTLKSAAREPPARAGDLTKFGQFGGGDKRTVSRQSYGPGGNLSSTAPRTNSNQISRNPSHSAGQSREDSRTSQAPTNAFAVLEGDSGDPSEETDVAAKPESTSARPRLNLMPKGATDGTESVNAIPSESSKDTGEDAEEKKPAEEAEDVPMPGDE